MRVRYLCVVATIATSALTACSDAAVEEITAPRLAATPATPVANQWPFVWEYAQNNIPSAIGIQIQTLPGFVDDWNTFVVDARVQFQWVNDVSASVNAWLVDSSGVTINSGSAGMEYRRAFLPVATGDTTFTVRVSTYNRRCGLLGKNSYKGHAAQNAFNNNLVQLSLWDQTVSSTTGTDMLQQGCPPPDECAEPASRVIAGTTGILASKAADCDDAPAPPVGNGGYVEPAICFTVWRELWLWDYIRRVYFLDMEWILGVFCYEYEQLMT